MPESHESQVLRVSPSYQVVNVSAMMIKRIVGIIVYEIFLIW